MPTGYYRSRESKLRIKYLMGALEIQTDECQVWPFSKDTYNYGLVFYQGKVHKAHRLAHKLTDRDFDDSLQSLHRCDNPPCFNPRHLFQGMDQDNVDDRERKGRGVHLFGEQHGNAKLTEGQIRQIFELSAAGETQRVIGSKFGVSHTQVGNILRNKAWKHIVIAVT